MVCGKKKSSTAVIIHELLESRLISKACFSICNCFARAPPLHLTFSLYLRLKGLAGFSVFKGAFLRRGLAFSPPGFLLRCNSATVCVLFSASLPASLRSHVLTHENRSTCARQTWISLGQLQLVCHSVLLLHLQHLPLWLCEIFISKRSTKGWLAYKGQWQMQFPLSLQTV